MNWDRVVRAKSRVSFSGILFFVSAALFSGCAPSGMEALLEGERFMREGRYDEAIERFDLATQILPTDAQAWNHLGLAYHRADQKIAAAQAYRKALQINQDLAPAHFNLGMLSLEQNHLPSAVSQLTTFTVLERDSLDGWLMLGSAQLRDSQLNGAEASFRHALRLRPQLPEALNGLGMVEAQRQRVREALAQFASALQVKPDFGPALLNLAILTHPYDPSMALQRYKNYLIHHPTGSRAGEVRDIVREIEEKLFAQRESAAVTARNSSPAIHQVTAPKDQTQLASESRKDVPTNAPPSLVPSTNLPPRMAVQVSTQLVQVARADVPVTKTNDGARADVNQTAVTNQATLKPEPTVREVRGESGFVLKPTVDVASRPVTNEIPQVTEPPMVSSTPADRSQATAMPPATSLPEPERRTIVDRLNPANWFTRDRTPKITPLDSSADSRPTRVAMAPPSRRTPENGSSPSSVPEESEPLATTAPQDTPIAVQPSFPRYAYRPPTNLLVGDRPSARDAVARGVETHRQSEYNSAIQAYREAVRLDPSFFEAHYNLGLAAYEVRDWPLSLSSYETALSIKPTSADTRYNFALALQRAGYVPDAAAQLEKIVEDLPSETQAHFSLAKLYAEQLHRPNLAAEHYRKVLDSDPRHPQASAIRFWLMGQGQR